MDKNNFTRQKPATEPDRSMFRGSSSRKKQTWSIFFFDEDETDEIHCEWIGTNKWLANCRGRTDWL